LLKEGKFSGNSKIVGKGKNEFWELKHADLLIIFLQIIYKQ
jgi:hypothetical protein